MSDGTDFLRNAWGETLNGTTYSVGTLTLHLYTSATDSSGGGTEVTGGSYAGQTVLLDTFAGGDSDNTGTVTFGPMPDCVVTHAALKDGSDMLAQTALDEPVEVAAGDTLVYDVGTLTVQIR